MTSFVAATPPTGGASEADCDGAVAARTVSLESCTRGRCGARDAARFMAWTDLNPSMIVGSLGAMRSRKVYGATLSVRHPQSHWSGSVPQVS